MKKRITLVLISALICSMLVFTFAIAEQFRDEETGVVLTFPDGWTILSLDEFKSSSIRLRMQDETQNAYITFSVNNGLSIDDSIQIDAMFFGMEETEKLEIGGRTFRVTESTVGADKNYYTTINDHVLCFNYYSLTYYRTGLEPFFTMLETMQTP